MKTEFNYDMPCPDCGQLVRVEFEGAIGEKTHDNHVTMRLVQSAPMICRCGFSYIPTGMDA